MQAERATNTVDIESQPWSKSSPNGEEVFVRRACLPSIESKLWYTNKPKAQSKQVHRGGGDVPSGLWLKMTRDIKMY